MAARYRAVDQERAHAGCLLVVAIAREDERVDAGVDEPVELLADRLAAADQRDRCAHAGAGEPVPQHVAEPLTVLVRARAP